MVAWSRKRYTEPAEFASAGFLILIKDRVSPRLHLFFF